MMAENREVSHSPTRKKAVGAANGDVVGAREMPCVTACQRSGSATE
jgi:hypothetical protein